MKKFFNKIKTAFNNAFYFLAQKYLSIPIYLQWLALGVIASPAVFSFLGIWFALDEMGDHSFVRWLLAVIPAFSMILGLVIGMSYATPPVKQVEVDSENTENKE